MSCCRTLFFGSLTMVRERESTGIPVFVEDTDPVIDDPSQPSQREFWFPANAASIKLVACLECLRDIRPILEMMATSGSRDTDNRIVKIMVPSLYSLNEGIRDLLNELQGNAKAYGQLTADDRRQINGRATLFEDRAQITNGQPLRIVRDTIGAHMDRRLFSFALRRRWELVGLEQQLELITLAITELQFLLTLNAYAWTRDSGNPDVFRLMTFDGVQGDVNLKEAVIVGVAFVRSPKYYVATVLDELSELCNSIATTRTNV